MSIASKIESISNHLENAYNSLEDVGVDLTNINKNIENLSAQIESIYKDLPKTTETNSEITFDNIKNGKMTLDLKGNTYQYTTTGKNLWGGFSQSYTTSPDIGTITTNTDGTITLSGSGTAESNIYSITATNAKSNNIYKTLSAGTYTASGGTDKYRLQVVNTDGTTIATTSASLPFSVSFTLSEETEVFLRAQIRSGITISNETLYFMLEQGSTASNYEPYTGGIASPNPDYPQNIQSVTENNQIVIRNRNFLNIEKYPYSSTESILNGATVSIENGIITTDTTNATASVTVKSATVYSSSNRDIIPAGTYYFGVRTNGVLINGDTTIFQQFNEGVNTLSYPYRISQWFFPVALNTIITKPLLLSMDSDDETYIPYEGQKYSIALNSMELCKIGNYQDYFYKNTPEATDYSNDRVLNAWYLKKNINKITFNGTENWDTQNSVFVLNVSDILVQSYGERSQIMLSDRFKGAITNYRGSLSNLCISKTIDNAKPHQIAIRYDDLISGGASSFKTWLSTHNTTAYYVLGTPIFTEITGTLATQLEALENAKSYENKTNIFQTNDNNIPFIITAKALTKNSD